MTKQLRHYGKDMTSREEWHKTIRTDREPFNAGAMTGRVVNDGSWIEATGDLPEPYKSLLFYGRPDYIVLSYTTPIAWHDSVTDRWTIPDVNYSLTTTQHQSTVSMAIGTWDAKQERWQRDYDTGPHVNLRAGKGKSPYGERVGY